MRKTLTFYTPKLLPKETKEYLCYIDGEWIVLTYSAKHQMFNVYDEWPLEEAMKTAIHVTYWANLPKL